VHIGHCRRRGRRVQARHSLQTSDALGAASTHVDAQAVALIVLVNKHLGLSHGEIATFLREWFGLTVRPARPRTRSIARRGKPRSSINDQYRVTFRWEQGHAHEIRVENDH
jgi:hypothetical protein